MKKILLILVVFVILFVFTGNQTCISENYTDICWSLQSSYNNDILKQIGYIDSVIMCGKLRKKVL